MKNLTRLKNFVWGIPAFPSFFCLSILLVCFSGNALAIGKITGFVVSDEFGEPIEKAVVTIPGTLISVLTDQQGKYELKMMAGDYFMEVNCPGYYGRKYNISVTDDITTPMFIVKLQSVIVGEDLHRRLITREDKTEMPQAIENFNWWQMGEQVGHPEFNELLRSVPSAGFLGNGSGFNDSEVGFRGSDASRTSYTFNGILLNNPETGRMNSAAMSGLTDWAETLQVTSGMSSGMQSQAQYGALVNTGVFLPRYESGVDVEAVYGNASFLKTAVTVNSGLSNKGLASSFRVSRTSGDGLVQNSGFEQYSLFAQVQKEFSHRHILLLSLNGVFQEHDRNFADSVGAYNLYSPAYNRFWGKLGSKSVSWSTAFDRNPMISLTHFWHSRIKTRISTTAYARFNRTAQLFPEGNLVGLPIDSVSRDENGNVVFQDIYDWNAGATVPGMGASRTPDESGRYINSENSGVTTLAGISRENSYGLRSVLEHQLNKKTTVHAGFDLQSYQAGHFAAVYDLLGADSYLSFADANRTDGFPVSGFFKSGLFSNYQSGDKVAFNYRSSIQTAGFSARIDYSTKKYYWFAHGSASLQEIGRTDYFNYTANDPARKSESLLLPGGNVQTGVRLRLWNYHSVFLKAGFGSYQPLFSTLFPMKNNWKNEGAKNEQVLDAEFGYSIFSRRLKIDALAYFTQINNRTMLRHFQDENQRYTGIVNDLAQVHKGVELKASYKLTKNFQLNVNGSLGDWRYQKDAKAEVYNSSDEASGTYDLLLKNVRVANAPQISVFAEAEYHWMHNFYIRLNYYRAEQLYAPFELTDFQYLASRDDFVQWRLPKYDLVGVSGNYLIRVRHFGEVNLIFGGSNLLDTEYIEQTATNRTESDPRYAGNQVFYGPGRTWFAGLKFSF